VTSCADASECIDAILDRLGRDVVVGTPLGVGSQFNFVDRGHELDGGRPILMIRSTRESGGGAESNVVPNYGHLTIPRHLRDVVVTEYGVADLRDRSDAEVIASMIRVADSRFQDDLVERAEAAGKLPADWTVPSGYRNNTPDALESALGESRVGTAAVPVRNGADRRGTRARRCPPEPRVARPAAFPRPASRRRDAPDDAPGPRRGDAVSRADGPRDAPVGPRTPPPTRRRAGAGRQRRSLILIVVIVPVTRDEPRDIEL